MSKERKTRSKLPLLLFCLAACAMIGVMVWYFQGERSPRMEIRKPDTRKTDIYEAYSVTSLKSGEDLYYIQLKDVVCNASAPGNARTKHYFRVSLTFETNTQEKADAIAKKYPDAVKLLRETIVGFRPNDITNERTLEYIKASMKKRLESVTGKDTISAVYFEEVLSQ